MNLLKNIASVFIFMNLFLITYGEKDEQMIEMTTQEPIDVTESEVPELANDIDGPGNETCGKLGSCSKCSEGGCQWLSCNTTDQCVAVAAALPDDTCVPDTTCTNKTCDIYKTCEECFKADCFYVQCSTAADQGPHCVPDINEPCPLQHCNGTITTTTEPPITTDPSTTPEPTSTETPVPSTTESPDTTVLPTTEGPNTTVLPTTEGPNTTEVPTTYAPSTEIPTTVAPPATTTTGPAAAAGGFSAGSFFGGATLMLALIGVGFGGYKFYKTRYDVNYRTL